MHDEMQNKLNLQINVAKQWLTKNKLTMNTVKTKFMIIGTTPIINSLGEINIAMDNITISRVNEFKYLGFYLDDK